MQECMVLGDFNSIKDVENQRDNKINLQMMGIFWNAIGDLEQLKVSFVGKKSHGLIKEILLSWPEFT
jgi:hypothetical protein